MATDIKHLMATANAAVPRITPARAQELLAKGDAVLVDVREAAELQETGKAVGAVHVPRGLLEFVADPESPQHNPRFDKTKKVVLYCAAGGRAALAGQALKELGYGEVYNLGGFKDWADSGAPIEPA